MASHQKKAKDWEPEWVELAKEYRKLAKRANQRMVRIERYAERPGYKAIKNYAYKGAQQDIAVLYQKKGEKLRYTEHAKILPVKRDGFELEGAEKMRVNIAQLKAKIASIEHFLSANTSTIADIKDRITGEVVKPGYISSQDKRANTLNERLKKIYNFDANLTADDLQRFFASKKQAKLQKEVGSDQMFVVMSTMKKYNLASNKRDLQKFFQEHIDLNDLKGKGPNGTDISIDQKDYANYKDYWNTLSEFVELTGNKMLDDYVTQAIKAGINVKNIFI